VYAHPFDFKLGARGVEILKNHLAGLAAVNCIGKVGSESRNIEIVGAGSDFLVGGKAD
jgi:hypothetical protein